ncbi:hypothetical protein ACH4E7_44715 [Kitasatospora sp. NPDC018058]|uniref:hypothetical protein n=1 Tax=Kitasatospora sp. NPDC018058 TaxID=3364025 RepID=UPI0037BF07A3
MLNKDEATALVQEQLELVGEKYRINHPDTPREMTEFAISRVDSVSFGWVFYWHLKEVIEGRADRPRLGGNGPFMVDREHHAVHRAGTARHTSYYVAEYERRRSSK